LEQEYGVKDFQTLFQAPLVFVLNSSTKLHFLGFVFAFLFLPPPLLPPPLLFKRTFKRSQGHRTFSRQIVRFSCATPAYPSLDHEMPLTFHA
jgi:hypothetical protein